MKPISECLAQNLRTLRRARRLTQEQLAEQSGLAWGTIQLLESQKRWPGRKTIRRIATSLQVPETLLFQVPDLLPDLTFDQAWEIVQKKMGSGLTSSRPLTAGTLLRAAEKTPGRPSSTIPPDIMKLLLASKNWTAIRRHLAPLKRNKKS